MDKIPVINKEEKPAIAGTSSISLIRISGYVLLAVSALSFLLILVIPWLGHTKAQTAGIITGLIITGEVTFYLSIFILGKSFWHKIKSWFSLSKSKSKPSQ